MGVVPDDKTHMGEVLGVIYDPGNLEGAIIIDRGI
jgi:hypothetical protein